MDALPRSDLPDRRPILRKLDILGKYSGQRMVISPGQHPIERVRAERVRNQGQRLRQVEAGRIEIDLHPARRGDVAEILKQAVAHIQHRGRPQPSGFRAARIRRARTSMRCDNLLRCLSQPLRPRFGHADIHPGFEEGETGGGPSEAARDRDDLTGPRARAGHGGTAFEIAKGGHTQKDHVTPGDITPRDTCPHQVAFVPQTIGEIVDPFHFGLGGQAEAQKECRGTRSHSGDIGEVLRCGLTSYLIGTRPIPPKVPTLEQQVSCHNDALVRRSDDGSIVTRAKQNGVALRQASNNTINQSEFAKISDSDDAPPGASQGTVTLRG
ncbi:hypothetical protein SAMN05421505_11362 [Sinosporangium album]|uniref:Uncharacterized protein n=1 Tax=Sinosporangium album TaxID=504805 RepID=A0A1G8AZK0_9ACTN|nr:hypothetical protein SAMN05421505_11362 [Sinosporangium album]